MHKIREARSSARYHAGSDGKGDRDGLVSASVDDRRSGDLERGSWNDRRRRLCRLQNAVVTESHVVRPSLIHRPQITMTGRARVSIYSSSAGHDEMRWFGTAAERCNSCCVRNVS